MVAKTVPSNHFVPRVREITSVCPLHAAFQRDTMREHREISTYCGRGSSKTLTLLAAIGGGSLLLTNSNSSVVVLIIPIGAL